MKIEELRVEPERLKSNAPYFPVQWRNRVAVMVPEVLCSHGEYEYVSLVFHKLAAISFILALQA